MNYNLKGVLRKIPRDNFKQYLQQKFNFPDLENIYWQASSIRVYIESVSEYIRQISDENQGIINWGCEIAFILTENYQGIQALNDALVTSSYTELTIKEIEAIEVKLSQALMIQGLYTLGRLGNEFFEGEFYLYTQAQHPLTDNDLYNSLNTRIRPNLGIVLCIHNNIEAREYPLPNNHYLMPIADIFSIQEGKLHFEIKNINQFLPTHKQINFNENRVGRPSNQEDIEDIYNGLSKVDGFLNKTVKEQAEIIHKELRNPISPTIKTITNKISKIRNAQNYAQNSNLG
jgi:hypothetical protein